jgi:hypothetical protein
VNASRQRYGAEDLAEVFAEATRVVVAKGKKVLTFDLKATKVSDPEFRKAVLGPSGNLRAPTIRTGKTIFVGFHPDAFGDRFA